ncbi:uncharacterized protein LOC142588608 [Dermacentor variabilis]|uniref:uncharacterized protein LOC142588608 n=1 Tax=Dermacentor variabilis TaxID=34621 RepID=UPI003F5B8FC0
MTAPASFLRGYDPDAMAWMTVSTSEDQNSAHIPPFRHQSLNEAVARRSLVQAKTAASTTAPASGTPTGKTQPPASRAAGSKGKALTNWKPHPFSKPGPDDFVVVLKPREHVSLHQAFSENRYGATITAYLRPELARSLTVLPSREQNLMLIHTPNPAAADQLLGDFSINTERGAIPLHGYLRQDGGDVCHGVIIVSNSDTTESLRQQVQWRAGTIVEVRKFGSSNKARVTLAGREKPRFVHYESMLIPVQTYYRTIPASGLCGAVGHRADACPNTQQDTCGLCGQQAPLVEGVRAPHECVPRCSVCGGGHATNTRECAAKFRTHKMAAPKGGTKRKIAAKKKSRHLGLPSESPCRDNSNTEKPAPPTGGAGKRPPTQPPPHSGTGKLSTSLPRDEARAWANAVKHGTQVSPLFSRALKAAGRDPLVIVGDFNAHSTLWGYVREEKRGRRLAELPSTLDLTLHTDPAHPTRVAPPKHNRKLKIRIAEVIRRAAEYAAWLADTNWFVENALEVILRQIFKRALDLPVNTSNQRLLGLGMVNTFAELRGAHLTNHYTRLSKTPSGRRLLARLHINHPTLTEERVRIPETWRYALHVRPLPANRRP